MKVQCTYRRGDHIPDEGIGIGYLQTTCFDQFVVHGRNYTVFGMYIDKSVIHYLVVNPETIRPDWLPAFLFEIVDHRLPYGWAFQICDRSAFVIEAIWGYSEMVQKDGRHYVDLIEREPTALEIFDRRRLEIEDEASDPIL